MNNITFIFKKGREERISSSPNGPKEFFYTYPYFKKNAFGVSIVFVGDNEELINKSCLEVFEYLQIKNGRPTLF